VQIEFLGSGGAITTPRPRCPCPLCVEARHKGIPYSRTGPSLFVHGPDVLIDTPEESKAQIDRAQITHIAAGLYSHWHPDHVAGLRVWETMNADWFHWPPQHTRTDVYLPQQVALDFRERLDAWAQLQYLQKFGVVRVVELADGDVITLGSTRIRPFRLAEHYVYAFLFEDGGQRVLIAPDELFGWEPPAEVRPVHRGAPHPRRSPDPPVGGDVPADARHRAQAGRAARDHDAHRGAGRAELRRSAAPGGQAARGGIRHHVRVRYDDR
jgi:phosphoribosyl 1,2-cyclic phosphate phosphodiesterase